VIGVAEQSQGCVWAQEKVQGGNLQLLGQWDRLLAACHGRFSGLGSILCRTSKANCRRCSFLCGQCVFLQVQQGLMEVPWPKGLAEMSEDGSSGSNGSSDGCTTEKSQQQGGGPGNGSGSSPPRKKREWGLYC